MSYGGLVQAGMGLPHRLTLSGTDSTCGYRPEAQLTQTCGVALEVSSGSLCGFCANRARRVWLGCEGCGPDEG